MEEREIALASQLGRIEAKIDSNRLEMDRLGREILRDKEHSEAMDVTLDARLKVLEQEVVKQKTITVVISGLVSFIILSAGALAHLFEKLVGYK